MWNQSFGSFLQAIKIWKVVFKIEVLFTMQFTEIIINISDRRNRVLYRNRSKIKF